MIIKFHIGIIKKSLIISGFIILTISFYSNELFSLPELSLWTGNKCSACHINMQGGGMRSDFGWKFARESSLFSVFNEDVYSIYNVFDKEKYSFFDSLLAFGFDYRYQSSRSYKIENSSRRYFPMQGAIYLNSMPINWIILEGQGNFGPIIFPGQKDWQASLILKPDKTLPSIRLGHFQPSMGIRDCDMTSLDRRLAVVDGTQSFIPPDFAEFGAEITYEFIDWFSLNAGIFDSKTLSKLEVYGNPLQTVPVEHNPTFNLKTVVFPELFDEDFPSSFLGASVLVNGKFIYYTVFSGYTITDNIFIQARYSGSSLTGYVDGNENLRNSENFTGKFTYMPYKGIFLSLKAETGRTNLDVENESYYSFIANQYGFEGKILILPYIEIYSEYKIIDCKEYKAGRWNFQIHLYY